MPSQLESLLGFGGFCRRPCRARSSGLEPGRCQGGWAFFHFRACLSWSQQGSQLLGSSGGKGSCQSPLPATPVLLKPHTVQ